MAKQAGRQGGVWIITTTDNKVAIKMTSSLTYDLVPNEPGLRKEWKSERGCRAALRRIREISPVGSQILYPHRIRNNEE